MKVTETSHGLPELRRERGRPLDGKTYAENSTAEIWTKQADSEITEYPEVPASSCKRSPLLGCVVHERRTEPKAMIIDPGSSLGTGTPISIP